MEESQQNGKNAFFWQKISKRTYTMAECLTAPGVTNIPMSENTVKDGKSGQVGTVKDIISSAENRCEEQAWNDSPMVIDLTPEATSKKDDNVNDADDSKKKSKADDKPVTFGKVNPISIQEISRIANQTSKMAKKSGNSNFLFLTAGAKKLLPQTGTKRKATKKSTKSNAPSKANASNDPAAKSSENTSDIEILEETEKSELATVGNVKGIPQRDMLHISKQSSNTKKKAQTVDADFLLLSAGANALLPEKGAKKKSKSKASARSSAALAGSACENDNGKRPHSPEEEYSDNYDDRRYRYRSRNYDDDYFCRVCDVDLNSEQTWIAHIEGKKHQKRLALYQPLDFYNRSDDMQYLKKKDGCRINRQEKADTVPKIQEQIEALDDPCVGLNFISEIWRIEETEDTYFCSLCSMTCYGITIVNHIIGCKHRMAYLKLFDPANYNSVKNLTSKKSELTSVLQTHAVSLEKKYGPGQMKVEVEVEGYVAPFETGRIYQDRRGEAASSALPIEATDLLAMPPDIKIRCLEETGACCDASEIGPEQFSVIERAVENLKAALSKFTPVDPMLNRRIVRFLQTESAYKLEVPPTPAETERFGPMQGYSSSYDYGFQANSQFPPDGYEAPQFGQMQGSSNYYMARRNMQMQCFSTYFDGGRRRPTMPAYDAREQNHPIVAPAERPESMHASHYPMDPPGSAGSISQMYIPPYPFGTERHEQPPAPQVPFKPQPTSTGRGVWGPIQSRNYTGPKSTFSDTMTR